jgi:UDP-N-acetylmuramyl pentapeptide phosphotransferase/UDP-N-acetylglucosamine-1-phosphate transferase
MVTFLTAFLTSFLVALLILRFAHLHQRYSADHDLDGVQKFHANAVPRIGGIAIFLGICAGLLTRFWVDAFVLKVALLVLLSSLPAFASGLIEDFTKVVSVKVRLLATFLSAAIAGYLLDAWLVNVQFIGLDYLLAIPTISILFTCLAVAGMSNAFNIIDGYNGLLSVVALIILFAIAYVSFQVGDFVLMACAFAAMGAISGFLVWNYPRGLIFLGDGGAYLLGFWVAELSILLVTRNPQVSKWFPVLVCFYPVFETLFTIYRRVFLKKTSAGLPDAAHLHQVIYRRVVRWAIGTQDVVLLTQRNSLTSPYLWALCGMTAIPAMLFWDNKHVLQFFIGLFAITYVWLYWAIVRFKIPKWFVINKK